jgi:predicted HicB family RNase H-like nuclease
MKWSFPMEPRELKTDNVILRIEPSKKAEWTEAAANSGMNLSRYISSCVDGKIQNSMGK